MRLGESVADQALTTVQRELGDKIVDARVLVRMMGYILDVDPTLPEWFEGHCRRKIPVLWVRPGETLPQTWLRVFHELGHFELEDRLEGLLLERACQRFAAALSMPAATFLKVLREVGPDLFRLAEIWKHSPPPAVCARISDLCPNAFTGHWDWFGRIWERWGDGLEKELDPQRVGRLTDKALWMAYSSREVLGQGMARDGRLCVRAFCVSRNYPPQAYTIGFLL